MSACIDKLVLPPRYIYRGGAVPPPRRETHLARAGVSGVSTLSLAQRNLCTWHGPTLGRHCLAQRNLCTWHGRTLGRHRHTGTLRILSTLSARAGPSHSAICARGTAPPWGGTATLGLCEYCDPLGTVSSLTLYTQRNLCVLVCDVTSAQQCCCVLR